MREWPGHPRHAFLPDGDRRVVVCARFDPNAIIVDRNRVKLFRLAWDIAGSAFGSRQVLYERFFASDPLTRARILNAIYPKEEVMRRVLDFLGREDAAS